MLERGIDEAPPDCRIENLGVAAECGVRLRHDEGRARHGLNAARQDESGFSGLDGARRHQYRIETRTAQAVDGCAGHRNRKARKQSGHPGHITIVLPSLVRTTKQHFVNRSSIKRRIPREQRGEWQCGEIVGAYGGERSAVAPDRRSYSITNICVGHGPDYTAPQGPPPSTSAVDDTVSGIRYDYRTVI